MLRSIKKFLQGILSQPSDIEKYVASKNPKNAGDIDHWVRVYSHRN